MLGMNTLRAIVARRLAAKQPEAPVETPEVRRMYAFANLWIPGWSSCSSSLSKRALTFSARAVSLTGGQVDRCGSDRLALRSV
jgi:hypothetical protein